MIKVIIKLFIKNYQDTDSPVTREAYGILGGVIGILCNILLFGIKLSIGIMMNSIAIMSDAFNNLSDIGSSLISIIGAKLSARVADHEHPFGHGRFEYIASLIISFIIMLVGIELLKSSIDKILHPEIINFNGVMIFILIISVFIKIWMFSYNTYIGNQINSSVNKATASDSLNDVIATSSVILTTIIGKYFDLPLDGYAGVIVSGLIMMTGFNISKETVNILLGMSPSDEVVNKIHEIIGENSLIVGFHDLKVHDYGPGRIIASIHTELSDKTNIVLAHNVIDHLEKRILKELGIDIVIHVDPIGEGQKGPID